MKNRYEFVQFLNENNCKVGIEIGSYEANYSNYILSNWKGKLYLVDVWRYISKGEYDDMSNQYNPKQILSSVIDNLSGYEQRAILIRSDSIEATNLFQDESLDFIYIDANHKYKYVYNDMISWYPKLKKGGIFSGHDWIMDYNINLADSNGDIHVWTYDIVDPTKTIYAGMFGVNKAVMDFCKEYDKDFEITTEEYFATWYFKK